MASALKTWFGEGYLPIANGTPTFGSFTLDASNDAFEVIFQADEAATITRLGFRYALRTGTPPTYKISLQGCSSTGTPDGTIKGGGTPASKTFTPPADTSWNGTWQWVTLDNSYTCTRGEELAIVIAYDSGTVDGSNNSAFSFSINGGGSSQAQQFPYMIANNAASRSKQTPLPIYGYASAGTTYGAPAESITSVTPNSGTTPDEYAIKFTVPAAWCSTYKVKGVKLAIAGQGGNSATINLYDTDGTTVLQNKTWDTDFCAGTYSQRIATFLFDETTLSTLTAGSAYRIGITISNTTSIALLTMEVDSAGDWDAWGGGQNVSISTRTDAGAWTDDTARRLVGSILLDDITKPAPAPVADSFILGGVSR